VPRSPGRGEDPPGTRRAVRASGDNEPRITRITRIKKRRKTQEARQGWNPWEFGFLFYPCYPCNPWFISSIRSNRNYPASWGRGGSGARPRLPAPATPARSPGLAGQQVVRRPFRQFSQQRLRVGRADGLQGGHPADAPKLIRRRVGAVIPF